jgi:hypothetical protein
MPEGHIQQPEPGASAPMALQANSLSSMQLEAGAEGDRAVWRLHSKRL